MSATATSRNQVFTSGVVEMAHGSGGRLMAELIERLFVPAFANPVLTGQEDQAVLALPPGRLVVSTDSYVVSPLFFPGGNIGDLAVHGTVNDVAMAGARPLYLTAGFIIEEGFPLPDLERIVRTMARAAAAAKVGIVTGDTKVVEKGKGDGVFINTTGLGVVDDGIAPSATRARPGDAILVSGPIGDHGVAILSKRSGLSFETDIVSDTAALHGLVARMVAAVPDVHCLRDPTRGGLSAVLNEIAQASRVGMRLTEVSLPVRPAVLGACELLGLDVLHIANEGKLVAMCAAADADRLLGAMRTDPHGAEAAIIGTVVEDPECFVELETRFGGTRIVDWIAGEQLPRIC